MNRLYAALMFFTRLPLWKVCHTNSEDYKHVVVFWPLTGWLTSGCMVVVWYVLSAYLSAELAFIIALLSRILLTGALHEDGLADFCDGFGGGTDKEAKLRIMKDSHIGTYGVIGLIVYFLLMSQMYSIPSGLLPKVMLCADVWSKLVAAQIINFLPYTRKADEAKIKTIYDRMTLGEMVLCLLFGLMPLIWFPFSLLYILLFPSVIFVLMVFLMKKGIGGYTGDLCGATFLLCELSFYMGVQLLN